MAALLAEAVGRSRKMTPIDMELALLDSAEYLYLPERSEPRDNSLQLVVQEAVVNRSGLVG